MAEIILRTADNTHIADIRKVLSCTAEEKLTTEKRLVLRFCLKAIFQV